MVVSCYLLLAVRENTHNLSIISRLPVEASRFSPGNNRKSVLLGCYIITTSTINNRKCVRAAENGSCASTDTGLDWEVALVAHEGYRSVWCWNEFVWPWIHTLPMLLEAKTP